MEADREGHAGRDILCEARRPTHGLCPLGSYRVCTIHLGQEECHGEKDTQVQRFCPLQVRANIINKMLL